MKKNIETRTTPLRLPVELFNRVTEIARERGIARNALIASVLWEKYMKEKE